MSAPNDPHDTEATVDRLEEKVLGHRVDAGQAEPDDDASPEDEAVSESTD